jgi:holliday junction DNA helicase RuvA
MIERLLGPVAKIVSKPNETALVLMVGGAGLYVRVPKTALDTMPNVGDTITLYTHLTVREDDISLYGFTSEEERAIFEVLISVSGVGPKMALAILGTLSTEQLRNAVGREDAALLTRVPGIGKKTAEKIIFELKGKLKVSGIMAELAGISDTDSDVIAALTALGYSVVEAQSAVQNIPRDAPKDVESRITLALQYFI